MALEIKQGLKTTHKLTLSLELKHSITILGLERLELENYIAKELEKNPCLTSRSKYPHSFSNKRNIEFSDKHALSSLHDMITEQISTLRLSPYEFECTQILLQYIDDNGFLNTDLAEIAQEGNNGHIIHLDDLKFALELIQKCDPPGVGARTLQECLLLQINKLEKPPPYARKILEKHWKDFEKQNFLRIAKQESVDVAVIKEAFRFIKTHLDPKPARQFGAQTTQVIVPDVYAFKRAGKWICSLNEDGLPRIKLAKKYMQLIKEIKNNKDTQKQRDTYKYINDNIKSAKWLIKSLAEREKTILKVVEVILKYQNDFFEKGTEFLVPLTLKVVAQELSLHESTVSRATSGKYLHSSRGIFELKYFFNTALENNSGTALANESIKQWVNDYIKNENKTKPLTDQEITEKIEQEKHLKIARRTVAKYRESLGLLSSSKRSQKF